LRHFSLGSRIFSFYRGKNSGMKREKDAEELLQRVPFFVRKRVKRAVEEYVSRKGGGASPPGIYWRQRKP